MSLSIKTAAIAGAMLLASVGGSFAATLDHDAPIKSGPHNWSSVVQWADAGDYVKVIQCSGNYCYVKINGPDGWVKKNAIDWNNYGPYPGPSPVQACFWGPYGYVCIN